MAVASAVPIVIAHMQSMAQRTASREKTTWKDTLLTSTDILRLSAIITPSMIIEGCQRISFVLDFTDNTSGVVLMHFSLTTPGSEYVVQYLPSLTIFFQKNCKSYLIGAHPPVCQSPEHPYNIVRDGKVRRAS